MPDSLFFPRATESAYPYADTEAIRGYIEHAEFIDPFVAMATMAAVTQRIHFYPGVLKVPVRQPLVLAKSLASIAAVSNGRVSLGAGLSPWKEDFTYNGVDFDKRGEIMDECIQILRAALTGEYFEHHGKHFDFGALRIRPVPPQPVPILVGATASRLRRAARVGDGGRRQTLTSLEVPDRPAQCLPRGFRHAGSRRLRDHGTISARRSRPAGCATLV
jgi:alkanesulfonate monooxygenase SsuD/methylene tetrahydromethanopterin reductase-like flavin-dependent oxidoreductase (luciferase family)